MTRFASILTQVSAPAFVATVLGLLAGRYVWPRRIVQAASVPSDRPTHSDHPAPSDGDLESAIASHQRQLATLRDQLHAAALAARQHEERLEAERLLCDRLRAALTTRDERIATLTHQLRGRPGRPALPLGTSAGES
jgi:hypothetical protein